ncbi:MAG TPA: hypothetical protein VNM87_12015, partial [Candidatus Udaeobacter sp.]|nr:hypothetical protein [Candidatus Udaeobacter sp.]
MTSPAPVLQGSRWIDPATGVVRAAFDLDQGPFPGPPAVAARAFLAASEEFGFGAGRGDDLELVVEQETPLG